MNRSAASIVDLHTHTTSSDGLLTPTALVAHACEVGLAAIAVTDHDSVGGVAEAQTAGAERGCEVIAGVELSCSGKQHEVHLLGYFVRIDSPQLNDALAHLRQHRQERVERMVQRLNLQGIRLQMEQVLAVAAAEGASAKAALGRPHVAQALAQHGWARSFDEAFARYLRRGAPAFVAKQQMTPREGIDLIHRAGGLAVVAHPSLGPTLQELEAMIRNGLDGIEVRHPLVGAAERARLTDLVAQNKLVPTGGSDYHGPGRSKCELGSMRVSAATLEALRGRHASVHA